MTDYRSILLYYSKGNNNSQIAIICNCARKTVIKTIKRATEIGLEIPVPKTINDKELMNMLFPSRGANQEYEMPNFEWEKFNRTKHRVSMELAWKRYQKRCASSGKKAYGRTQYYKLYREYFHPVKVEPNEEIQNQLKAYNLAISLATGDDFTYNKLKKEKEAWLKSLHLDEEKL